MRVCLPGVVTTCNSGSFICSFVLQWMLEAGFIRQSSSGTYHMLPLAQRALENIISIVDQEMAAVGGAKMAAPILTPSTLWKRSG